MAGWAFGGGTLTHAYRSVSSRRTSPQLNPIEGLWGWMKRSVIYNVFFRSVKEIVAAVDGFLAEIAKNRVAIVDRLCTSL